MLGTGGDLVVKLEGSHVVEDQLQTLSSSSHTSPEGQGLSVGYREPGTQDTYMEHVRHDW